MGDLISELLPLVLLLGMNSHTTEVKTIRTVAHLKINPMQATIAMHIEYGSDKGRQ